MTDWRAGKGRQNPTIFAHRNRGPTIADRIVVFGCAHTLPAIVHWPEGVYHLCISFAQDTLWPMQRPSAVRSPSWRGCTQFAHHGTSDRRCCSAQSALGHRPPWEGGGRWGPDEKRRILQGVRSWAARHAVFTKIAYSTQRNSDKAFTLLRTPPPPSLAHARPCLSTGWALNRRFEEILGPLFLWSRMEDWVSVERLYRERGAHSCL